MYKFILATILFALASSAYGQGVCTATSSCAYNGAIANAPSCVILDCGGSTTPPPVCTPPKTLDPVTNTCKAPVSTECSASQVSSPIGTRILQRQCAAGMTVLPSYTSGSGDGTDLAKALGGAWPIYSYSGYTPTWQVRSGYYVALAFTPTTSGFVQFAVNLSYGDGGIISLSTVPGALTRGAPGAICVYNRSGSNSLYVSTIAGSLCSVRIGTTYWINFADVDANGNPLCYGSRTTTCAESKIAYTLQSGAQ